MTALYNEFEPHAAAWTRNLVEAGLVAAGTVDERSILDLRPEDVRDATQVHYFAGIACWSRALRLAGIRDDERVWTGSCPCQPWSSAGRGDGAGDERHLWPAWFELIRACRPVLIFGEQVASAAVVGRAGEPRATGGAGAAPPGDSPRAWFDVVRSDLEAEGYAVGMAVLPACGVGAPHKRERLFFGAVLADAYREQRRQRRALARGGGDRGGEERLEQRPAHGGAVVLANAGGRPRDLHAASGRPRAGDADAGWNGADGGVADAAAGGLQEGRDPRQDREAGTGRPDGRQLGNAEGRGEAATQQSGRVRGAEPAGEDGELANAVGERGGARRAGEACLERFAVEPDRRRAVGDVADTALSRLNEGGASNRGPSGQDGPRPADGGLMGDAGREGGGRDARAVPRAQEGGGGGGVTNGDLADVALSPSAADLLGDSGGEGLEGCGPRVRYKHGDAGRGREEGAAARTGAPDGTVEDTDIADTVDGGEPRGGGFLQPATHEAAGFWADAVWIPCRDGKRRPVESVYEQVVDGTAGVVGRVRTAQSPLVDGAEFRAGSGSRFEGQNRAGMLRGYGNAIVAEAAAAFIRAFLDTVDAGE